MAALTEQIEAILPDLWRYGYSLTRDRDRTDDLVQDCVERLLRRRSLWQATRPLKPWAMTVLLNLFRDQRRYEARRPLVPIDGVAEPSSPGGAAEDRLELAEVTAAIDALPQDQREALLLVVMGGLSYKEAAQALSIAEGTLMSRLSRARGKLSAQSERPTRRRLRSVE